MNKIILSVISIIGIICCSVSVSEAADSTVVRIRVDIDSAVVHFDQQIIEVDNFGSRLLKNSPFIISVLSGEHFLQIYKHDSLLVDTVFTITDEQLISIDFVFIKEFILGLTPVDTLNALPLIITSEPDSASIYIDSYDLKKNTPYKYWSHSDSVDIDVVKDGYEPLRSSLRLTENGITAMFKLRRLPPSQITADSLGVIYETERPPINIRKADAIMKRYSDLSETFLIFPFVQGIIAKLVVNDDQQTVADVMVLSGVGLTVGSYLFGKIFSNKKRKEIIKENQMITKENLEARAANSAFDKIIKEKNKVRYDNWELESSGTGVVEIKTKDSI